ncbi:hypothetical protein EGK75_01730 [Neisseria weixii]|uniref:Uncharacterized protein n=1 Tax=Neisseria weixii TaxID=1853276 RepID=A0A3N4N591_9NEIS|nr:hypothetical protein EGK74_01215 [Neisseria weixii]RPD90687.1 hypothetical protein EGK75_01730 [Neisseria weixii]
MGSFNLAIAVVKSSGHLLAFARINGTTFITCDVAVDKA